MKNKQLFTLCLLGAPLLPVSALSQKTEQKPNIVVILADDMQMDH